ncbi:MAG: T9SS type A sorting domain-containing protein [Bacteroidota bacterium]
MRHLLLCLLLGSGMLWAQPGNNTCGSASSLLNINQAQNISVDLNSATESLDASCETAINNNLDVWYSFTMPFDGQVQVNGINPAATIALYDACGGTELFCLTNNGFFQGLINGTTYYFRYASPSNQLLTDNFTLQAFPPPANDSCTSAQFLTNIELAQPLSIDLRGATQTVSSSCESIGSDHFDVWYSFTMPFDGKVQFTGIYPLTILTIWDACNGTEVSCETGNGFSGPLTSGTTYWLSYSSPINFLLTDNIIIQAFAPPPNDSCQNAVALSNIDLPQTLSVDLRGANGTDSSACDAVGSPYFDVWFSFTMPFDGNIQFTGVNTLAVLAIYDACGGNEVDCELDNGFSGQLTGGNTYWLRYAARTNLLLTDNFTMQAFAPPANDLCAAAIPISNIDLEQTITVDLRGAGESLNASCETASQENLDVWYHFTMPFDGKIHFTGVNTFSVLSLFDACSGNEVDCMVGNAFSIPLTSGQAYWLRYSAVSHFLLTDVFNIQAFAPPPNDSCQNAIPISNIDQPQTISLDLRGTAQTQIASCESAANENLDVWYSLTLPFDARLRFTSVNSLSVLSLFDACGGNEVACVVDNGVTGSLTGGQTYWLRYSAAFGLLLTDDFVVQAFAIPPNDSCHQAQSINNPDQPQSISFDVRGGTEDLDADCDVATMENLDIWYTFTMPFEGKLWLTGLSTLDHLSLYDACGGTELDCFIGNGAFDSLQTGATYLLRLANTADLAMAGSMDMQAFAHPENDECTSPDTFLTMGVTETLSFETRGAYESLNSSCETATDENLDLWFTFHMPFFGELVLSGSQAFYQFSLYDSCMGPELACLQGNGSFVGLVAGQDYLLRFGTVSSFATQVSFDAQLIAPLAFPEPEDNSPTNETPSKYQLSPNPATEWLTLSGPNPEHVQLDIYDLRGQFIQHLEPADNRFSLQGLKPGLYLMRGRGPGIHFAQKMLVRE